jgi:hypothetical protein
VQSGTQYLDLERYFPSLQPFSLRATGCFATPLNVSTVPKEVRIDLVQSGRTDILRRILRSLRRKKIAEIRKHDVSRSLARYNTFTSPEN